MERLKFEPKGIEGLLGTPLTERRLRNKEACVVVWDAAGNVVMTEEGLLLNINNTTSELLRENGDLKALILVHNNGCIGLGGLPSGILEYKPERFL